VLRRNVVGLLSAAGILLEGCAAPLAPPPASLGQVYEHSIHQAAVRDPGFSVPLQVIDSTQVTVKVATFTEWGVPASPLQRPTWISIPAQLQEHCRGKPDAVLAIQQILGLPPAPAPTRPDHSWQVIMFSVPRQALFRPCPGGTDIGAGRCSAGDVAPDLDEATARFLLRQLWTSYRVGPTPADDGYPFTGMGWSYNWDPASPTHVGIAEYVVRPGAPVRDAVATTPSQFCNATG
jgi:hypothetical protein